MTGELVIGGKGMETHFGLRMLSAMELKPPEPKVYTVDIPGGDGVIDLTEAVSGDTSYSNRVQAFEFDAFGDFELAKMMLSSYLHGKAFDYTIPGDPGYVYRGRWSVDSYEEIRAGRGRIRLVVDAEPYKSGGMRTHEVDAQAGAHLVLKPGRGRVQPVFESKMPIHVMAEGVDVTLPAGSHTAVGLTICNGDSEVYVNTGGTNKGGSASWADLADMTWGQVKSKRWHEVMWITGAPPENDAYKVKIAYEVKEL